jgi:hypothetical protein
MQPKSINKSFRYTAADGQNINDNPLLEREADMMGQRASGGSRWHW